MLYNLEYAWIWLLDIPTLCRELPDISLKLTVFLNMRRRKVVEDFEFLVWISYFVKEEDIRKVL